MQNTRKKKHAQYNMQLGGHSGSIG